MTLRKKILLLTVSVLVVTIGSAYFLIRDNLGAFVIQRFGFFNKRTTTLMAGKIGTIVDGYIQLTRQLAGNLETDQANLPLAQWQKRLNSFRQQRPFISGAQIVLPGSAAPGKAAQYPSILFGGVGGRDLALDEILISPVHISEMTADTVLTISSVVRLKRENRALLRVDFSLKHIFDQLRTNAGLGATDEFFLVNEHGYLVSPSRFKPQKLFALHIPDFGTRSQMDEAERPAIYKSYMGYEVFGTQRYIPNIKLWLFNEVSLDEANLPLSFVNKLIGWTFLIFFLIYLAGALWLAARIVGPINILNRGIRDIEQGRRVTNLPIRSNDELSELAISIMGLQSQIIEKENRLNRHSEELEEQVKSRTAELDEKIKLLEHQRAESLALAAQLEQSNAALHEEISEREKIESVLKESEMRYRIVMDITSDYSYALEVKPDGSLKNLWMIGAFKRMTGFDKQEILDRGGWENLIHPDDMAIAIRQVGLFLSGKSSTSEYRIIGKGGEIRWVRDTGRVEWDAQEQRIKFIYGAVLDITVQKQAQEELKKSELSYRQLFDNLNQAIFIQDADGRFLTVNRGAMLMYGYEREDFIGKTPQFVAAPGMNRLAAVSQATLLAFKGKPQRFELWAARSNGEIFPAEVHLSRGTYFGREVVITFMQDISERRSWEERLRSLSQAVEQMPIALLIVSPQTEVEYVNSYFKQFSGFADEEILHRPFPELLAEETRADFTNGIWPQVLSGTIWRGELQGLKKDNSITFDDTTISPIYDQDGEVINYIVFRKDISEKKNLEEQFRQSQKMEAIGRLAGGVAHDFNNLLTVIIGYSELILGQIAKEDTLYNKIVQIDKAGRRAEGLTRQLLAFSRKQMLQPKTISLNTMIAEMERMLKRLIGEHIELQTILNDDLNHIKGDPGQLEQVVMNLCINARDAMPDGGSLTVATENLFITEAIQTTTGELPPGDYVKLSISDSGLGMDEAVIAQIFEPFFTTKEKGKGTGLGLSTVYGIIIQSKGAIDVFSEEGRGTTFTIYFPRSHKKDETDADLSLDVNNLKGSETVFVVEDEDALRSLTVETLSGAGYRVITAIDGEEALSACLEFNGEIHLLLTDVVMPKMNGRRLAEEVTKIHPETRILFMSGYTDDDIFNHDVLEGDSDFISKPFKPSALLHKIRLVLDHTLAV